MDTTININVNSEELDIAIEKANRLAELLEEVQQIVNSLSGKSVAIASLNMARNPYERTVTEWKRFELLTENEEEKDRLERVLAEKSLSRQELAIILFGLRVLPGFGKKDFGI